ncbi:hypothetical protein CF319_g5522 [Tilletia indica]|uniref:Uncharacterized protein n=1 Tax=Tilletia indica TaxID=43049 RepID=A0A177TU03_9BASI|nr:hypothetical protein CF319_g5522 [Tilletia indica]KAE8229191.1 hypothetical protein CF326_g5846 [Tilletia indica]KAE8260376.1 hypothetical protein A4X13_0g377 [Tilletia indica]
MTASGVPQAKKYTVADRPKRSMRSTWYTEGDWSKWNFAQRFLVTLGAMPPKNAPKPPHKEPTEPVGVFPELAQWAHWFPTAAAAPALQYIYMKTTGKTWSPGFAYIVYVVCFIAFAINAVQHFNRLGLKHGYFDSKHNRDSVPDQQSYKVLWSLVATIALRPLVGFYLAYDRNELPNISIWFPLQAFAYATTLDLFFYCYHRAMHEVPFLWKFHQRHHETHWPSSLLSPFADEEQDFFDIVVVPLLTFITLPMSFHTWWLISLGILYTEAMGHCGVRLYWGTPLTAWILRPLGMDLALEDHDIHHRHGWKDRGGNYGKQTRVWDTLFGTKRARIETKAPQIDWNNKVSMFD